MRPARPDRRTVRPIDKQRCLPCPQRSSRPARGAPPLTGPALGPFHFAGGRKCAKGRADTDFTSPSEKLVWMSFTLGSLNSVSIDQRE